MAEHFWNNKGLDELSTQEWESLCDGCARCCLFKLEDEDSGVLHTTSVVCRYLDMEQCRCSVYEERSLRVPDCVRITPENVHQLYFMPHSCAYRRLAEGQTLPEWHPLLSGSPETVREAGISACTFAISETQVGSEDDLEDYIID